MSIYNLRPNLDIDVNWTMKETVDFIKSKDIYLTFFDNQIWLDCSLNEHFGHRLNYEGSYPGGKLKTIDVFDINEQGQTWLNEVIRISDLE